MFFFLRTQIIFEIFVALAQIHYPYFSMIIPIGHYRRIAESTNSVDIKWSENLLKNGFGFVVIRYTLILIVPICFWIIVISRLVKFGPFSEIDTVVISSVA